MLKRKYEDWEEIYENVFEGLLFSKTFFSSKQRHNAFISFFCQAAIDQVEKLSKLPLKKEKEKG